MKFTTTKSVTKDIWFEWNHKNAYRFYIVIANDDIKKSRWVFITTNGIEEVGLLDKKLLLVFGVYKLLSKLRII